MSCGVLEHPNDCVRSVGMIAKGGRRWGCVLGFEWCESVSCNLKVVGWCGGLWLACGFWVKSKHKLPCLPFQCVFILFSMIVLTSRIY